MSKSWVSLLGSEALDRDALNAALESARTDAGIARGVPDLVQESWQRSFKLRLDPDRVPHRISLNEQGLRDYRSSHPLAPVLPVIHRLLIRHSFDAGLIVAVGDAAGWLLWIDGDRNLRTQAEQMLFVEGADWSEQTVGTSAPGTALALDRGIQIRGAEHFTRIAHPWSCTAVPVHDPLSGAILGVIDITGGADAVAPATLPLIEATVAAVEAELRLNSLANSAPHRIAQRTAVKSAAARGVRVVQTAPLLSVLGRDTGLLHTQTGDTELSSRHTEILTLLAWHPRGLSAEQLAAKLHEHADSEEAVVTVRAEMVRLRKVLRQAAPAIVPASRPYRLDAPLELDAHRVLAFLDRGAHRVALGAYAGAVLGNSSAPGIVAIRTEVRGRLREALLAEASVETLLSYARSDDGAYDSELWRACLALLPTRSPKRSAVVTRIEQIEAELDG